MKKEKNIKCYVCGTKKGKRKCYKKDGYVCGVCCSQIRDEECANCSYYQQSKVFEEKKNEIKKEKTNFILEDEEFITRLDEELDKKADDILILVEQGDIETAFIKMKKLYAKHSDYHSTNYGMGVILIHMDRKDEAMKYFDKAVKIFPLFVEAWFNKAELHRNKFEFIEMTKAFLKVTELTEASSELYQKAQQFINMMKQEAYDYEIDFETYMKYMDIYNNAVIDLDYERYSDALEKFKKISKKIPKHYQACGNIGVCYIKLNKPDNAKECFKKALIINPDYEIAQNNLKNLQ